MLVTVKLFAGFRQGRFVVRECKYAEKSSILQVIQGLAIPLDAVGVLLRNGRHVDFDTELVERDVCSIFPKVGGG